MKACPFCAENIQDAAVVCRFCQRDLTTSPQQVTSVKKAIPKPVAVNIPRVIALFMMISSAIVGLFFLAVWLIPVGATRATTQEPTLQIRAGRGALGLQITNQESDTISDCHITSPDGDTWHAYGVGPIQPSETIRVPWGAFLQRGQSMPGYLGLAEDHYTIACTVRSKQLTAGLAF